ncbi:MAG: enoyl-CoA hydratase/isomerase family protein [Phycisphaerales bacterium]
MLDVRTENGIDEVIFNRPDKRNALTTEMLEELAGAAARSTARCILLRGEGARFCAGFDLTACREQPHALGDLLEDLSKAVRALRRAGPPVVIAAHGAAIAGGCALLAGGDFVVTDRDAKIGYPVVTLGISPAVSGPSLVRVTNDRRARERMLNPSLVSGEDALRVGLVSHCEATPEEAIGKARELAAMLASKPPVALQRTRAWIDEIAGEFDDRPYDAALNASMNLVGGDEERERLARIWNREGKNS